MKRDSKDPTPTNKNTLRQGGDGNVPVTGEYHDSKKAEMVKADQRFTPRTGDETQPTRQGGDGNVPV